MSNDPTRGTTWAVLLSKWTAFARASAVLADDGEAGKVKRAVPSLIGLQAVTNALMEISLLAPEDRPAAVAMGDVLIRQYGAELQRQWAGAELPGGVRAFVVDAASALIEARRTVGASAIPDSPDPKTASADPAR